MNKIYNNLNINNLIKTDWFNQFDEYQKGEIISGIEANLDVLIYAKKEFDAWQMEQIKKGLKDNLDVSIYAKSDFNCYQMEKERLKLENNRDL